MKCSDCPTETPAGFELRIIKDNVTEEVRFFCPVCWLANEMRIVESFLIDHVTLGYAFLKDLQEKLESRTNQTKH